MEGCADLRPGAVSRRGESCGDGVLGEDLRALAVRVGAAHVHEDSAGRVLGIDWGCESAAVLLPVGADWSRHVGRRRPLG